MVAARWTDERAGTHYRDRRFRGRRELRDPRAVAAILARHDVGSVLGSVLDVPCGSGRLHPPLRAQGLRSYVGVDVSPAMLAAHPAASDAVVARAERLPFRSGSFDAVVACRLLHHLRDERALELVLAELVRVARQLVVVSFWDTRSLPGLRRGLGLSGADRAGRVHRSRASLARALRRVGARPLAFHSPSAFLSAQSYAVASPQAATVAR